MSYHDEKTIELELPRRAADGSLQSIVVPVPQEAAAPSFDLSKWFFRLSALFLILFLSLLVL